MGTPLWCGRLFFNYFEQGWVESYPLVATSLADAQVAIGLVQQARLPMLANDCTNVGGQLVDLNNLHSGYPTNLTYGPGTEGLPSTFIDQAIVLRFFDTTTGKYGERLLRGLGADLFDGVTYTPTVGFMAAISTFITTVTTNCQLVERSAPPKPYTYTPFPINAGQFERASVRKTGRAFFVPRGRAPAEKPA